MIRGLYTAASAMLAETKRTDVIANNLANAATVGFRRDEPVLQSFHSFYLERLNDPPGSGPEPPEGGPVFAFGGVRTGFAPARPAFPVPIGRLGVGAEVVLSAADTTPGPLELTGNPLDLAIGGEGYFVLQTQNGPRYTRSGNFTTDGGGFLATQGGDLVLGERGPIPITGGRVVIQPDGTVLVDDARVDKLLVVSFPNPYGLVKEGASRLVALPEAGGAVPSMLPAGSEGGAVDIVGGAAAGAPVVRQGYLERSNVNVVTEMVRLIEATRNYQMAQKAIQAEDDLLGKTVNELGRVG